MPASPESLTQKFINAINTCNPKQLQECCSKAFWFSTVNGPQDLLKQKLRKNWRLALGSVSYRKNRMVSEIKVVYQSKIQDTLYLYGELQKGKWHYIYMDERDYHVIPFLEGRVPAHLAVNELPSDLSLYITLRNILDKLPRTTFIDASSSYKELNFPGLRGDKNTLTNFFNQINLLAAVNLEGAYHPTWSSIALAILKGKRRGDFLNITLFLHLKKEGNEWELLTITHNAPDWKLILTSSLTTAH